MALGKIDVEQAAYESIKTFDNFEIRLYAEAAAVDTPYEGSVFGADHNKSFQKLASYIGVFGNPQNTKKHENAAEQIAMTAPVLTSTIRNVSEQIAMTAPVLNTKTDKQIISFILPSKYTVNTAPLPLDPDVTLRKIPERFCAVVRFSGACDDDTVKEKAAILLEYLKNNSIEPISEVKEKLEKGEQYWEFARYNPPWTPPLLRTNDVMIPIEYCK